MKNTIIYDDLENHFTTPKTLQIYSKSQRVPRKFKKKWKDILNHYSNLKLQQKLWYLLYIRNTNYHRFLIKKICEQYNKS
jgi:hypothetical protein